MANELSGTNWSETPASNNVASPNGWPEGMAPSGVNDSDREFAAAVKRAYDKEHALASTTVGGTANAITLTLATAPPAYVRGEKYAFLPNSNNTGAVTINVNALGAKNVMARTTAGVLALVGNELVNSTVAEIEYDGTQFQLLNPVPDDGTWTPVVAGSSTAGTQTYSVQQGTYTRIGNLVTALFSISLSAKDGATAGNVTITGLPYTASASVGQVAGSLAEYGAVTISASYNQLGVVLAGATKTITMFQGGSGVSALALPASGLAATSSFVGSVSYRLV